MRVATPHPLYTLPDPPGIQKTASTSAMLVTLVGDLG